MMWVAVIFVYLGGFASVVVLSLLGHEWVAFFALTVLGTLSISASPVRRAIESAGDAGEAEDDNDDDDGDESDEETSCFRSSPGAGSREPGAIPK